MIMASKPLEFCNFDCPHADFPPPETAGLCRTMSAVWCQKLKELVHKNAPCEWRRRAGRAKRAQAIKTKPAARGRAKAGHRPARRKTAKKAARRTAP